MNKAQRERMEKLAMNYAFDGEESCSQQYYYSFVHGYTQCFEDSQVLVEALKEIANPEKCGMERKIWNDIAKNALKQWEAEE